MIARRLTPWLLLVALAVPASAAPGIIDASVSGSVFSARIQLLLLIQADLTISFEGVENLSVGSLGVSAELINPLDPAFLARLPPGGLVGVPIAFPVLIKIAPPPGGGLELTGIATLSLYTHLLNLSPTLPLRMFSAPMGGPFTEVTDSEGPGSLRIGNRDPEYSDGSSQGREYAVLIDFRQVHPVIGEKLNALALKLEQAAGTISEPVLADLTARLAAIREAYENGAIAEAVEETDAFSAKVLAESGVAIPDVWRASGDLTNHAGRLRADVAALRYGLLKAGAPP